MRSLWRFVATLALAASLVPAPALAQTIPIVTVAGAVQPQGGSAAAGSVVAMVAVIVSADAGAPATITGLTVQRVGSAPDSAIAGLEVNDSASSTLASVSAQFDSSHKASIPLDLTLSAGQSKTLLVSATIGSGGSAGQSLQLNLTDVSTSATLNGVLPVYGAQVTLVPGTAPPACSLHTNTSTYSVGDTINLSWSSRGATGGTITGLGSVGPSGLQGILPGGSSQTFVGTFTGPGGTANCSLTLTLNQAGTGGIIIEGPGTVAAPGANTGGGAVTGSTGGTGAAPAGGTPGTTAYGLVPCSGLDCRPCDSALLAQNVINTGIGLSIPLAAAMFAWAGILYFTSAANPSNVEKARRVFKVVFWGFLVAVAGWLIIQTLLRFVLAPSYYQNWNSIQCTAQVSRPGTPAGGFTNLPKLFDQAAGWLNLKPPTPVPLAVGTGGGGLSYSCQSGTLSDGRCVDVNGNDLGAPVINANSYVQQNFTGAGCSGLSAQASCVARYESGCNSLIGSGVDLSQNGAGPPVSWGMFQVNLSAHSLQCNGTTLNCPQAFGGGAYTSTNHGTYVRSDAASQSLYTQCVNLAQDPQCSLQMYNILKAQSGSLRPWGNAAYTNCSGL